MCLVRIRPEGNVDEGVKSVARAVIILREEGYLETQWIGTTSLYIFDVIIQASWIGGVVLNPTSDTTVGVGDCVKFNISIVVEVFHSEAYFDTCSWFASNGVKHVAGDPRTVVGHGESLLC